MNEENLYHPVTIGSTTLGGNLFLAPLAGYTDIPFRTLCIEEGADFTYTEMVSAEGLARKGQKTLALMGRAQNETKYAVQLFMGNADSLKEALEQLQPYQPEVIDINCGCPVPKVTKTGAGSAMMKQPKLITEIVHIITEETDIPVSVKLRTGWDAQSENFLEFAQAALDGGASALTLHARTRSQGYAPFADWSKLTELKQYTVQHGYGIPVFGSGDLFKAEDAKRMLEETGIDGVMFARGAIGNPFIFSQAKAILQGKEPEPISIEMRKAAILRHLDLMIDAFGERTACTLMRKHTCSYLKGIPNTSTIKQAVVQASRREQYLEALSPLVDL
ncbi:tRNA dihydrouridine synthase DusB [Sphaerochaeta halotolerans]|jgi:nifR3 family TIM-barrel protein|uniref:tRNA-dihydrouridine synthase n=1 Tax=Sphaerochaeta halotolerans TaxID=2293840 RepID=A0A372MK29_9SPIR|nr:tRNA dihydrouridine synthase DusB [Sphaerochaeta halotolerans]MBG0766042.1 tRNA dihydrouridine synthase DusB [Spirochaetaceae bacterium]MDK2859901.1 tRNA-dihydrouridine synthase [Sphaerochaeta sp.]MXI87112.1 tRNA dihydrouridine synthase DusB [Sphaerochaeta halotolerans]RFU95530.1 tRNA dihydrouridine synthase DusB [Sphaerochaeta halotolerans]